MIRKKTFLFYLFICLIQVVHCRYGSSRKFSGRSVISSISSEANRNYEYSEFKTDKIVAEEYVQKLVGKTQYFKPEIIEADIYCEEKVLDGENPEECKNITSKDKTVAKILEYVYLKIDKLEKKEQFENIILPKNNCNIGFPLPKNIFGKAFLFDSALNFSGDDLEELIHGQEKMVYVKPKKEEEEDKDEKEEDTNVDDDEDDEEGNVQLSTLALLEAIYKGSKGFGNEDIFLDWEKIPEKEYKYEIGKRHRIKDIAKGVFLKVEKILRKLIKSIENKINKIKRKEKIKSWFKYPFSIFKSTSSTISIPKEEIAKEEKVNSPLLSDRKETEVQEHREEIHSSDIRRSPFLKKDLKPLRSFNEGTSLETGKKESTHKRYRSADDIIQVFQSPKINDYTTSNDDINEVYETDDFDKDEFEDKDIKGIRKLEKTGKANIDEKLKLEINERIKSIKQKWLNELKLLKTIKEREDKIKEWKEILDNWEKRARDIFEEKIIIIKDDAGHKILTEQKVHPFKFLQEVIFEVSIKPTDKRFKKITVEEYEEVIEFLKNTEKFIIWPPKKNNESKEKNNFDESYKDEKEENDDKWGNHEIKWVKKLNERILRFIFYEMKMKEKELKNKEKNKKNEKEGNEGEELVEIKGESSNSNIKEINKEEEEIKEKINNEYINDLLNEEFKFLKLKFSHRLLEWFQKKTKNGRKKVESYRNFDKNVFIAFKNDLLKSYKEIENCLKIKDLIKAVLHYEGNDDPIHMEFRGRLGAQIIASVYNSKQLTKDILRALILSLGGAGIIAIILDVAIWPSIILLISLIGCPLCGQIIGIFLYSLTPLFAETFDSLVIKRFLITLDGGNFWPNSLDKFLDNLKDAAYAGKFSAGGSILNNTLEMEIISEKLGWSLIFPNILSNQIASSTSGAMIPLEFNEWRNLQRAALYKLYDQGFFPKPDIDTIVVEWRKMEKNKRNNFWHKMTLSLFTPKKLETSPVITHNERNIAFKEYIKAKIEASMDIQKKSAMAINSMGIGALLSQIVLIAMFFPAYYGLMPQVVVKIFLIMVNTPTEINAFVAGIIASYKFGWQKFEKWFSTDTMKNKQMVRLIIDRTIKQMEHPNKEFQEIKEKEVYQIYHPKGQILYSFGKGITKLMIVTINGIKKLYNKMRRKPIEESLFKQINISKLAIPLINDEEIQEDLTFNISYLPDPLNKMLDMPGIDDEKFNKFINGIGNYIEHNKLTLTESHHYMIILNNWENLNKNKIKSSTKLRDVMKNENNIKFKNYFEEIIKEYEQINNILNKTLEKINNKENIIIYLPMIKNYLSNFETNIEYKSKIKECSLYAKILHFTALEIDNEDEDNDKIKKTKTIDEEQIKEKKIHNKYKLRKEFLLKLKERLNYENFDQIDGFDITKNAPDFLALTIKDYIKNCKLNIQPENIIKNKSWIPFRKNKYSTNFNKVERHFGYNLEKELKKEFTKDDKFKRKLTERIKDLFGKRLNLKKYLKRMAKRIEKFLKKLEKILEKLDNQNLILEDDLNNINNNLEKFEQIKEKIKFEDKSYRERFVNKYKFLQKNWKYLINLNENMIKYKEYGYLFIGYCLAKRFQFIFNNEGKAKTKLYKNIDSHLLEYSIKINQILKNRKVDLEFYKELENNFKQKINEINRTESEGTSKSNEELNLFFEENWGTICLIDREHVEFERPDEWKLQTFKTVHDDDFLLADMNFLNVDPELFKNLNLGSNEWFDFKQEAVNYFNLHKLTFTEANIIIVNLFELIKNRKEGIIQKEELKEYFKNKKNIYRRIFAEIENRQNDQKNFIIKKELSRVETSIKLKNELNECLLSIYLFKFIILQINQNLNEEELNNEETRIISSDLEIKNLKELFNKLNLNLQNKCNNINEIKLNNEINENKLKFKIILNKLNKNEEKIKEKLEKLKNNYLKEFNKKKTEGSLELIKEKLNNDLNDYINNLNNKLLFLIENFEKFKKNNKQENLEPSTSSSSFSEINESTSLLLNNQINISSLNSIIYCLIKRFLDFFNEDGVVNMDILLQNISNKNLIEYGMNINEKLGMKRVDIMYYQQILEELLMQNNFKNNWYNYCYIDKNNLEYERPEEWAIHYNNEIGMQKDGFRLEQFNDFNLNENEINLKQKENILQKLVNTLNHHKVLFFEAHRIINLIEKENQEQSQITTEILQQQQQLTDEIDEIENISESTQIIKQKNIDYKIIKFELEKIKNIFKIIIEQKDKEEFEVEEIKKIKKELNKINLKYFKQFEWKIKLKTECQKCIENILIIKILNKENNNLIEELKNKCNIEKINNYLNLKEEEETNKLLNINKINYLINKNNLNKLLKLFKQIIIKIENINPLIIYFNKLLNIIKKLNKKENKIKINNEERNKIEKNINLINKLINNSINEFNERLKEKYNFLKNNWKKIYNLKNENKNIFYLQLLPNFDLNFENSSSLFIGYCLTKRILNSFNNDGQIKFSEFLSNGIEQEYGLELKELLGQTILNINFYENKHKQFKEQILNQCNKFNENLLLINQCELLLKHLLQSWHSFCSINTKNLNFERFEEMNIISNGYDKENENIEEKKEEEEENY